MWGISTKRFFDYHMKMLQGLGRDFDRNPILAR